ncbi:MULTISPECIES: endonuclease/exonuclease/phosphatase family protein [unclassified Rathayibacter]|uniref:endonuclease/exonuclease/phosphatase family protein n=1 Tax=unclassified Rathayibacter TaxID=2609250 RepID=UPI00188C9416|nr:MULTISPECIES: endonuclease/exonuclease/phosphatase family protein [unclassified Rathayibacter]MBF4462204.1 endonuclease/exonuclease/phosphatase family protein [Rathayibacter sp. VKM Ac-2879]MBF4503753.1 endonuclease/exonuclease/phosphatase family protein [Rathayibacter sp. VKM Ac-2878]
MPSRTRRRSTARTAVVTGTSLALAGFLAFHRVLPDPFGWLSVVETAIPWSGLAVVLLLTGAMSLRSRRAAASAIVLAMVYGVLVLPVALPGPPVESGAFTVLSQNIGTSGDAGDVARALAARGPDAIALQEVDGQARDAVDAALSADYPYSFVTSTVGLWSRTELSNEEPLDLGLGWDRALAVDVDTPLGSTRVFVVHLASFRPGDHAERDTMLSGLASTLHADDSARKVVIGDFNTPIDDHLFAPVLAEARLVRSGGIGFPATWPSLLPVVSLDHALAQGIPASTLAVLPPNGSDHRPISLTIGSA